MESEFETGVKEWLAAAMADVAEEDDEEDEDGRGGGGKKDPG